MSWWNYKGNAENLFAPIEPRKKVAMGKSTKQNSNKSAGLKNNGADKKCDVKDKLKLWNDTLNRPKTTVGRFMVIFQNLIQTIENTKKSVSVNLEVLKSLHSQTLAHLDDGKSQKNKNTILKVFYAISHIVADFEKSDEFIRSGKALNLHAMLHSSSDYFKRFEGTELQELGTAGVEKSGKAISLQVCRLPYDLQAVLKVFKLVGCSAELSYRLWRVVCLNLESRVMLVRELSLMLFTEMINDDDFLRKVALPEILTELSWQNRNKYDLLGLVFSKYDFNELAKATTLEKYLNPDVFFQGLRSALDHEHLLASSQNLVKALSKNITGTIVEVLQSGSDLQVRRWIDNFAKHMDLDEVFEGLALKTLNMLDLIKSDNFEYLRANNHANLVLFRNVFQKQFGRLSVELVDNFIKQNCMQHTDYHVRQQVLQIWLDNVTGDIGNYGDSLKNIVEFVKMNQNAANEQFIDFLVERVVKLLKQLIAKVPPIIQNEKALRADVKLFATTEAIYELMLLSAKGAYAKPGEILVGANIFLTYVEIYPMVCPEDKRNFVYRNIHNRVGWGHKQLDILRILTVDLFNYKHHGVRAVALKAKKVLTHLEGDKKISGDVYEGLRNLMITEWLHYRQTSMLNIDYADFSPLYLEYLKLFDLQQAPNTVDDMNRLDPKLQARIVVTMELAIKVDDFLKTAIENFEKDPLQSIRSMRQPYAELDYLKLLHQKIRIFCDDDGMKMSKNTLPVLEKMMTQSLKKLNLNDLTCWATPERMEASLNEIVLKSSELSDMREDRKVVLNSLWYSLRSVADFASHLAIECLKKNKPADIPYQCVIRSLKILTRILLKCCQKDAIEAAGKFLGQVIAVVTNIWSDQVQVPFSLDKIMDHIRTEIIDHVTNVHVIRTLAAADSLGLCTLYRQVAQNDASMENEIFQYCLSKLLPTECSEMKAFVEKNHPLHLVLLSELVQTSALAEKLVPFMDLALILAFEQSTSLCDTTKSAAGRLQEAVTTNLAVAFQSPDFPLLALSFSDLFTKYPSVLEYMTENVGSNKWLNHAVLTFLAHLEHRSIGLVDPATFKPQVLEILAKANCGGDTESMLAGKVEAQLCSLKDLPDLMEKHVTVFLQTCNPQHFFVVAFSIERYTAHSACMSMADDFNGRVKRAFQAYRSQIDFFRKLSVFVRLQVLDRLIFVGFKVTDAIVNDLIQQKEEACVKSKEENEWQLRVAELQTGTKADDN